jgi:hypothetical protein
MTIPVYVVGACSLLTVVYISDRLSRRGMCIIGCLVPVIIGYLIAVGTANKHAGYAAMFVLVLGQYIYHMPLDLLS